ncbi:HNH endonuclease [Chromobacterium haemolyticum]|uniref:HNH endonuclease n=1 Tax=Chromobacterium TaxID=535 RepID=UPI004055F5F7
MKERPMLYTGAMVRAVLADAKTMTRRIIKPQPDVTEERLREMDAWIDGFTLSQQVDAAWQHGFIDGQCPYGQPGDRLIVSKGIPHVGRNYCAGSDGVIYSRARGDWRPLKAHGNANGYPSVTIMDGSRKTTRTVHSLVCEAFYGAAPFDSAQVRHLDGNPENSLPENLAWGTQAENWRDRKFHGNGIEGEKHHSAKLSDVEREHVRWGIERGLFSQRHAARMLGMTQSAICQLVSGAELEIIEPDTPTDRIPTILLEITDIRVERLQDISEADAKAEGITPQQVRQMWLFGASAEERAAIYKRAAVEPFRELWEQINGAGSWNANPWVWVIEFKKVEA